MTADITPSYGFLRNRFGESYLPDVNRRVFESEPSSRVFERRLTDDFEADDTLFVVVGSDSGLLSEYLRKRPLGKGSRRLLIESDELHGLIAARAAPNSPAAELHAFSDWATAIRAHDPGRYVLGGRIVLIESLGCVSDHGGVYMPILHAIRAALSELVHRQTAQVSHQAFIRMQLHNACENAVPADVLRDVGVGHTAVVLGGGPSLDEAIDWVSANRHSLFLMTASRLCGRLQQLGIRPDLVVAVDPQPGMYDVSKEGLRWNDVPLAHSFHLAPQLLHQWRGPRLYLGELYPWVRATEGDGNFPAFGPTVSHTAAWLAHCWRFDRILLCGVDLCYAVGGSSHASGSVESMLGALPSQCDVTVRTYAGRLAGTKRSLEHGAAALEELGRIVNAERPRLYNTSENAARIDTVPLIGLDAVEPGGRRPELVFPPTLPSPVEHLERVRREQRDAGRRFGKIARLCREANVLLDAMEAAPDPKGFHARRRRLERLEKGLGKEHGPWYDAIKRYSAHALLATARPSGFGDEDAQRQDWGRQYYRTIMQTAEMFEKLLRACDERTSMRLAELEERPDVDALLDYWAGDGTPGRVLNLRERLGRDATEPGVAARVAAESNDFLATLEDTETGFKTLTRAKRLNPGNLLRSLNFMFREKIADDLASLAKGLRGLDSPHDLFAHHASGLHAELERDTETALREFQRVIDGFGERLERGEALPEGFEPLLESALQHIAQCCLGTGDGESAAGALALLAQLSPLYVSRYAHLLHLLGRHEEALETLELHVRDRPEDWRALLQIADVYAALDSPDAATMARRLADEARSAAERIDRAA